MSQEERDRLLQRLLDTPLCCLRLWFCRRIRAQVGGDLGKLKAIEFKQMINFWVDDGEAVHIVRNERQHSQFNRTLMSRKKAGAHPSQGDSSLDTEPMLFGAAGPRHGESDDCA